MGSSGGGPTVSFLVAGATSPPPSSSSEPPPPPPPPLSFTQLGMVSVDGFSGGSLSKSVRFTYVSFHPRVHMHARVGRHPVKRSVRLASVEPRVRAIGWLASHRGRDRICHALVGRECEGETDAASPVHLTSPATSPVALLPQRCDPGRTTPAERQPPPGMAWLRRDRSHG
jgi:hypothetical protein